MQGQSKRKGVNMIPEILNCLHQWNVFNKTATKGAFFLSFSSLWNRKKPEIKLKKIYRGEGRGKKGKKKSRATENVLRGSAVTGMHLSIQGTHPCRTSKTGLGSLPILTGLSQGLVCDTEEQCRAVPRQGSWTETHWSNRGTASA